MPDTTAVVYRDMIISVAERYRLPTIYPLRVFVSEGDWPTATDNARKFNVGFRDTVDIVSKPAPSGSVANDPKRHLTLNDLCLNSTPDLQVC